MNHEVEDAPRPGSGVSGAHTDHARYGDDDAAAVAAGPVPLGVERTPTGHEGVDALLERLGDADHLPADGHIEVYEDVHRGLREALTALDARPGPPAPPSSYDNRS
ncbi:hypothetical protein [Streptomyces chryseus]|uniref:Uncharacterized protein n=1 Tax=Streptomyces chryseus TaxID=68186 RepID=A0ABQ3DF25_9ACTN|nr:hypothetical protein [Streptomyces chryseus]GHA89087.1 hypothetical protein GCM10010346_09330 [Streptomyces chryseus]